jgi:ATP-dependent RNA helicase SUPV3L1/SUV3
LTRAPSVEDRARPRIFRELAMIEVEPSSVETDLSTATAQIQHNFSVLQGFQVVGAEDHLAAQKAAGEEAWRDAVRLELEARAARFHQAVDAAIVLSNDGVIRWLGDPVARLSAGPNILTPGTVIFADESLPAASRDIVKMRIELWLSATTRRVLGPLFALEALQEGSDGVRDLAGKLARSLGILERESIRGQIKALGQDERAELRKQGVRFGAYYIFVPTLIKPAARTLALHLWSLQTPGDADGLMRALAPIASSGRTSLVFDSGMPREGYRVAGYRVCGERIVRVDVLERLAGMVRAAIVEGPSTAAPGGPNRRTSNGFVVSGQMTSLTGCSGEQFASILRSMGFQSVEMRRSEFFGSSSPAGSPEEREPIAQTEPPAQLAQNQAPPPVAGEKEASVDPALASPAAEAADAGPADLAPPTVPADKPWSEAAGADPGANVASPGISGASGESADASLIVVWRLERRAGFRHETRRKTQPNRSRASKSENLAIGTSGGDGDGGRSRVPPPNLARAKNRSSRPPSRAGRPESAAPDEKRRQTASDRDMPRVHATSGQEPRAKVDPDSPFAKLLELRSLLERQANKRP